MSNFTDLIAEEQVLLAVMKAAQADLSAANERKSALMPGTDAYEEMTEDIKSYRDSVIVPLREKLSDLDSRKKSECGITDFSWRH